MTDLEVIENVDINGLVEGKIYRKAMDLTMKYRVIHDNPVDFPFNLSHQETVADSFPAISCYFHS